MAARRREDDQVRRDTTLAWTVAQLQRQKKLPSLKALLTRVMRRGEKQTVGQMKTSLHLLSEMYGGSVAKPVKGQKPKRKPKFRKGTH